MHRDEVGAAGRARRARPARRSSGRTASGVRVGVVGEVTHPETRTASRPSDARSSRSRRSRASARACATPGPSPRPQADGSTRGGGTRRPAAAASGRRPGGASRRGPRPPRCRTAGCSATSDAVPRRGVDVDAVVADGALHEELQAGRLSNPRRERKLPEAQDHLRVGARGDDLVLAAPARFDDPRAGGDQPLAPAPRAVQQHPDVRDQPTSVAHAAILPFMVSRSFRCAHPGIAPRRLGSRVSRSC